MRRKKEGASLIVVIIIFMFITSVSVAMLSMISGNYRARVSESNRVENLYSSESGLDVAYNIMVKTFDAATTYGYYEVEALKKGNLSSPNNPTYQAIKGDISDLKTKIEQSKSKIRELSDEDSDKSDDIAKENQNIQKYNNCINEDNKMIEILLNEEFKRAFKYFISDSQERQANTILPNQLISSIIGKTYINDVTGINRFETVKVNIPNTTKQTVDGNTEEFPKLSAEVKLVNKTEAGKEKSKTIKPEDGHNIDKPITINIIDNDVYNITLQSIFQSTKEKTNTDVVDNNLRTVQTKYNIYVPEYSDIFFGKGTENVDQYVVLENKALMVQKEMNVDGVDKLNVTGNVFVQGKLDSGPDIDNSNRTYEKYDGGIIINSNGAEKYETDPDNVVFNNDVITRGTFNLQDNMKVNISGSLYAKNFYAGKISSTDFSDGSILNANDMILDNDLTIKADKTHIKMSNFYGINDKNTNFDNGTKSYNNTTIYGGKERTSSSIIVNSPDANSTVNISDKAYIMGVAHINTDNGYQTGESVAVKGNYLAYAVPIDSGEQFIPDPPLQVLDDDENNVFDKANHFSRYWNKVMNGQEWDGIDDIGRSINQSDEKPKDGGISFDNPDKIYSTGAIVYKSGNQTVVRSSSQRYNIDVEENVVNNMRRDYATQVYRMGYKIGDELDLHDYDYLGTHADSVEDFINFQGILDTSDYSMANVLGDCANNNGKEIAIFNPSSDTITIDSNGIKVGGGETYPVGSTINAVIVTKGDVNISGDVTINGNIITCGKLNIGSGNINISYDQEVIDRIKLKNSTLFKNVFGNLATEDVPDSTSNKAVSLNDVKTQYDINKFLKNGLWRIPKDDEKIN